MKHRLRTILSDWTSARKASRFTAMLLVLSGAVSASAATTKIEDNASGWSYTNFPQYTDSAASGGTAHGGTMNGGSGQYIFTGNAVDVYSWKGSDGGSIELTIDGVSKGTQSLASANDVYNQKIFSITGLTSAQHTLVVYGRSTNWNMIDYIIVTNDTTPAPVNGACGSANGVATASAPTTNLCSAGTASAVSGSGPYTWSCAGANGGTTASCAAPTPTTKIEDNATGWTYTNFPQYSDSAASGGTAHGGTTNGGSGQYIFTGTSVDVYSWKGSDGGSIELTIDGVSKGTQSLANGTDVYNQKIFSVAGLTNAQHTLVVYGRSTNWNMIDYIIVGNGSGTPPPPPTPVNGSCGSANGVATSSAPTTNLCAAGTASSVTGTGPYNWSCAGSNGGTTASCSAPGATAPNANAFYVAPNGSDSNAGTLSAPFATLGKAQASMRASSTVKTTYLRAGTYTLATQTGCYDGSPCGLKMTSADNGQTYSYYPGDGYNSATLDGLSTANGNGQFNVISLQGVSNVVFDGFRIRNFQYAAFAADGGTNITIKNMELSNGTYVVIDDNPAAISMYGTSNATISHNVIHDMASWGIAFAATQAISNMLVDGNVVYNTCTKVLDCSAIYEIDDSGSSTNIRWTNNYILDGNAFAAPGSGWGSGLYADDCASNITMSGNVLRGANGSNTIHLHGGNNLTVTKNIIDLGTAPLRTTFLFQTTDATGCSAHLMSNVNLTSNVVVSSWSGDGSGNGFIDDSVAQNIPNISGNDYFDYGSGTINHTNDYADKNPATVNPQISGYNYSMSSSSPVLGAPVNFTPATTVWGYPGYTIPTTGSAPSVPH